MFLRLKSSKASMELSAYRFSCHSLVLVPFFFSPLFWVVLVMWNEDQVRLSLMLLQGTPEAESLAVCCTGPCFTSLFMYPYISSYLHKFFCKTLLICIIPCLLETFIYLNLTQLFVLFPFMLFVREKLSILFICIDYILEFKSF